jgi:hypothetical protein
LAVESGDVDGGGGAVVVAAQAGRLNNDLLGLPSAMGMAMRRVVVVVGVLNGCSQGLERGPKRSGKIMLLVLIDCAGLVTAALGLTCLGASKVSPASYLLTSSTSSHVILITSLQSCLSPNLRLYSTSMRLLFPHLWLPAPSC